MIGTTTRRLTQRSQSVKVLTVSSLREFLDSSSSPECRFQVDKVARDRVTVRAECPVNSKRLHPIVVFPAYATGHADDLPGNPNVVLDPLEFVNAETHAEREIFVPLIGHDVLVHFEKMHPSGNMPFSRCC